MLLDKLKSVKLNTPEIRLNKPHVVSAVISCHLPGYLTGCQIPGYLMENTRVFVNKTGVLKNTRVFFVKYPGIFQYPGNVTLHRGYLPESRVVAPKKGYTGGLVQPMLY